MKFIHLSPKGWSRWWCWWCGREDFSSPGGSNQSRAKNWQHFKSLNLANGWGHINQTDSPTLSHGCQRSNVEFFAQAPLLFALKAERLFLVSANSKKKHPTTPTSNMLKSHKITDNRPPFLLTASCESPPPPPPTAHFQLKLKKKYQSVIYFRKQGRGQTSHPLQNWN